jgi:D-lactate dehydrogenase
MKVVAYSIKNFEKELLAKANQKKHDITLISNPLNIETAGFAAGKDAVLVSPADQVTAEVIEKLALLGIKHISTRSVETEHIDRQTAGKYQIKLANVPSYSPDAIAEYTLTLALALNRKVVSGYPSVPENQDVGFNLNGKTVGIVGMGNIGKAVAKLFNGLGCRVLVNDLVIPKNVSYVQAVSLDALLAESDIVTLHIPANEQTRNLVNSQSIQKMKDGVMLINTSSQTVINLQDTISAIESGKIAYFGMDAYQHEMYHLPEKSTEIHENPAITRIRSFPNVLVTSHRAFLTREALQEIANQTIRNLDNWHMNKCVGKACACAKSCQPKNIS